jgi:uncharacterized membrane protein
MASKSKRARQAAAEKSKSIFPVLVWSLIVAMLGYLQNRHGQFSDIRGFYGMRFMDGLHHWPYNSYIPAGATVALNPIEYPAVTGIVVWLLTFFVPTTSNPIFSYFAINAFVNAILFMGTAYFVRKMTDNKHTYLYILAPAVVMALNLNWDLWAMLPMLAGLYYFERKKYNLSAFLLGLSIAAKFFPIVLLLPIFIYMMKSREFKKFIKYSGITALSWIIFNFPVMLASFEGWKFFYTFSFSRGMGDGSIYSIFTKLGFDFGFSSNIYYLLNVLLFGLIIILIVKNKDNLPLATTAFLTMFAFTYFGKQYSMQYVIWLTPLAVVAMAHKSPKDKLLLGSFITWQLFELAFRLSYFENLLTNVYAGKPEGVNHQLSDQLYGLIGVARYLTILLFALQIVRTNTTSIKRDNAK